ncbi:MAG: cytochrome b/b6 domain-containing protein [Candidatus Acidiferrales bacterium]
MPIEPVAASEGSPAPAEPATPEDKDKRTEEPPNPEAAVVVRATADPEPKLEKSESANNTAPAPGEIVDTADRDSQSVAGAIAAAADPQPVARKAVVAVYEHPLPVRICHWLNSISLVVMAMSGFQIFMAFPSFGPKIPQNNLIHKMPSWLTLGGWLGGALPWHFTFGWIYVVTGVVYVVYQALSGNFRQMLFVPRDIPGVWPMVRHYLFFGPKPTPTEAYNPLQKIAYTSAIFIGAFSLVTGMVLFNPVQFSFLTKLMGGFHRARIWHLASLGMLAFFILGHLMMVAIHGLNNFVSMLTGWKRDPEYVPASVGTARLKRGTKDV